MAFGDIARRKLVKYLLSIGWGLTSRAFINNILQTKRRRRFTPMNEGPSAPQNGKTFWIRCRWCIIWLFWVRPLPRHVERKTWYTWCYPGIVKSEKQAIARSHWLGWTTFVNNNEFIRKYRFRWTIFTILSLFDRKQRMELSIGIITVDPTALIHVLLRSKSSTSFSLFN